MKNLQILSLLLSLVLVVAARAETPEPELGGVVIDRPDGGKLQMVMEDNRIHFYFFDAELKQIAPDVDRISVRIRSNRDKERFTVAIPFEGMNGLRAPFFVNPPHIFIGYLTLMRDGEDDPVETYVVPYKGS